MCVVMKIHQLFKKLTNRLDFQNTVISSVNRHNESENTFKLYSYIKPDGSFDYESYKNIQTRGNKEKINNVWVTEENITFLSKYILNTIGQPQFGICHGTRRGKEQEWFRKHLNCEVIGTEISETASDFPNTIQWDFHEVKTEWLENVDFIYSNSFDHSYDPKKCLNSWMNCVKKHGICIIEHTYYHGSESSSELDPFGADIVQMPYLILTWGQGQYGVRELIKKISSQVNRLNKNTYFIIVQKL